MGDDGALHGGGLDYDRRPVRAGRPRRAAGRALAARRHRAPAGAAGQHRIGDPRPRPLTILQLNRHSAISMSTWGSCNSQSVVRKKVLKHSPDRVDSLSRSIQTNATTNEGVDFGAAADRDEDGPT